MNTIAFFADGDATIGLGHLTRLRSLANYLKGPLYIFSRTPHYAKQVFGDFHRALIIDVSNTQPKYLARFIHQSKQNIGVLVLDPPIIKNRPDATSGPAWQAFVDRLRHYNIKVVRITDEAKASNHCCDLLINDHPLAKSFVENYLTYCPQMKIRCGLEYFLIDRDHKNTGGAKVNRLLVSFGGGDQSNLLTRFSEAFDSLSQNIPIDLVVGPAANNVPELNSSVRVYHSIHQKEFASLLGGAKAALTAAGNTMFERVFHKIPGLSVAQFRHQDSFGWEFQALGLTQHLGLGIEISPPNLVRVIQRFWDNEKKQKKQIAASELLSFTDGCETIVKDIQKLLDPNTDE